MDTRKPLNIVDENLKKPSVSDPSKSITDVLLDGTYKPADLFAIMFTPAFPDNKFSKEEPYTSGEAMSAFVAEIGPYLSNAELHALTNKLIEVEIAFSGTQAMRTETLTKPFLKYELERCAQGAKPGELSPVALYHMKKDFLPLIQEKWGGKVEQNLTAFIEFNLGMKGIDSPLQQITDFSLTSFNAASLDKTAPRDKNDLLRQYSTAAKQVPDNISTPTQARKTSSSESRVKLLTESVRQNEAMLAQLKTRDAELKEAFKHAVARKLDKKAAEIMREISTLDAPGHIAKLEATIRQAKSVISKEQAPPPIPPKKPAHDSVAARDRLFNKKVHGTSASPENKPTSTVKKGGPG